MSTKILLIGDPRLRQPADPVEDPTLPEVVADIQRVHAALRSFRHEFGYGRAVAAPQLGISRRIIAVDLGEGPFTVIDPIITRSSEETFTLWDDCMSIPFLRILVRRHASIDLEFKDEHGKVLRLHNLVPAHSELFQHEIDHLDGILAPERAVGPESLVAREVFDADPRFFQLQADRFYDAEARLVQPASP